LGGSGLRSELVEDVKIFAGLEANCLAWCDGNFGAGARIAAYAGLARLDGEDTKSAKFNALAFDKALLHGLEDGVYGSLGLGPDEPGTFHDPLDQILFDQSLPLLCFLFWFRTCFSAMPHTWCKVSQW
jgi:hypothetical protein